MKNASVFFFLLLLGLIAACDKAIDADPKYSVKLYRIKYYKNDSISTTSDFVYNGYGLIGRINRTGKADVGVDSLTYDDKKRLVKRDNGLISTFIKYDSSGQVSAMPNLNVDSGLYGLGNSRTIYHYSNGLLTSSTVKYQANPGTISTCQYSYSLTGKLIKILEVSSTGNDTAVSRFIWDVDSMHIVKQNSQVDGHEENIHYSYCDSLTGLAWYKPIVTLKNYYTDFYPFPFSAILPPHFSSHVIDVGYTSNYTYSLTKTQIADTTIYTLKNNTTPGTYTKYYVY